MVTSSVKNRLFAAIEANPENKDVPEKTVTLNQAPTYVSSGSEVLNLFSRAAAMRNSSKGTICTLVEKAIKEDAELGFATIFYIRDILDGQGERTFFRTALNCLVENNADLIKGLIPLIPNYGRWDDLYLFEGTELYPFALEVFASQLKEDIFKLDMVGELASISLAAKWAGSQSSGKDSRRHAIDLMQAMGFSNDDSGKRKYRKIISRLRNHLNIVETQMCSQQWDQINYSHVPSRANLVYRHAFKNHDGKRYQAYLDELKKPKEERDPSVKMNTKALYPFDIVRKVFSGEDNDTLEVAWDNLPDYLQGEEYSALVVADTSGSMMGNPMNICISLALYIAERNKGIWKDRFISFSQSPTLQTIQGKTITEKCTNLSRTAWGQNTDLYKVFRLILNNAKTAELSQEDLPKTIIIISDMQFDFACQNSTNFELIDKEFSNYGYVRPNLVFWNVNASLNQESPVRYDQNGTALVSGMSPTIFKQIAALELDPIKAMLSVLMSDRYQTVRNTVSSYLAKQEIV